jgi:hypothetical protein
MAQPAGPFVTSRLVLRLSGRLPGSTRRRGAHARAADGDRALHALPVAVSAVGRGSVVGGGPDRAPMR